MEYARVAVPPQKDFSRRITNKPRKARIDFPNSQGKKTMNPMKSRIGIVNLDGSVSSVCCKYMSWHPINNEGQILTKHYDTTGKVMDIITTGDIFKIEDTLDNTIKMKTPACTDSNVFSFLRRVEDHKFLYAGNNWKLIISL